MMSPTAEISAEVSRTLCNIAETVTSSNIHGEHTVIYWLLGLCITGIISSYAFMVGYFLKVSDELAKIYALVDEHIKETAIHTRADKVVYADVCQKEQELTRSEIRHINAKIDGFSAQVINLDGKVDKVLVNLTKVIGN